jgi:hypothetical protein
LAELASPTKKDIARTAMNFSLKEIFDSFNFEEIWRLIRANARKTDAESTNRSIFAFKLIMKIWDAPRASNHQ